ncbi:hypothetical protein [Mucilaginibacter arboris]|uniref:Uncharacterized protein n=1 Tax=Mucilaginibacter arboris TaxID=2682090 RepID=A0A7K1T120_9SPHI|nr:hypothetical protein [Mucilaginibacter arboris]MVN23221.1 hypothetical protein [Mucilaginibacter arboris]
MSVLVNTKNEQEEKVLLAFLDSLRYDYQSDIKEEVNQINYLFINHYNDEIDQADSEIENFVKHEDVEQLFQQRRKAL